MPLKVSGYNKGKFQIHQCKNVQSVCFLELIKDLQANSALSSDILLYIGDALLYIGMYYFNIRFEAGQRENHTVFVLCI